MVDMRDNRTKVRLGGYLSAFFMVLGGSALFMKSMSCISATCQSTPVSGHEIVRVVIGSVLLGYMIVFASTAVWTAIHHMMVGDYHKHHPIRDTFKSLFHLDDHKKKPATTKK